jgi:hypothetical protein
VFRVPAFHIDLSRGVKPAEFFLSKNASVWPPTSRPQTEPSKATVASEYILLLHMRRSDSV